ncbi:hypothetical protein GQ43DRAFT_436896 [Delitschia confertaspora ATCC 74209]|uniref:C2H2-type domain-containing protein n=1 Tax=Delitschia confertaspora ATCC 74209 TaxID=1513339 RepID=A0A9P4MTP9_9PLEO|nr:hypothetical protein GQ43DRAFT_436896 [Delitschia confertaspora ATCC 74209]
MNMESDDLHLYQFQPQSLKRPRHSLQSPTPLSTVSESASPAPSLAGSQLTPEIINHINALKHLDDQQIFYLLEAARNIDRNSISTLGSRSSYLSVPSSRVTSTFSDPRSSIASTDTSFSGYSSASRLSTASRLSQAPSIAQPKNFACTFCDKKLKSKPYWKSHEEEFHEQRLTWRCPDCEQIFNAGKRFREHHFKLHGCENCKQPKENGQPTSRKASPCVKKHERVMHDKNAWGCGFCADLLSTWEERCEHIAAHFEDKTCKWNFTNVILALLKQPDVAQAWRNLLIEKYGEDQHWPQFTWDSKKSHRLRYKLETKFNTQVFEVKKLVQEAFDLAIVEPVESKTEPLDLVEDIVEDQNTHSDQIPSTGELPIAMELDAIGSTQTTQQPQWAVSDLPQHSLPHNSLPHHDMATTTLNSSTLSSYSFATNDFSQSVSQSFHQQSWPSAGFLPSNDIVPFQQHQDTYMDYMPKQVASSAPFESLSTFPSRSSAPVASPAYISQQQQQPTPTNPRRRKPKLVDIPSHRELTHQSQMQEEAPPPPPPPKDSHRDRFSLNILRRRPSNISQHTTNVTMYHWQDENNWG